MKRVPSRPARYAQGGPFDTLGVVEFRASYVGGVQHERSSFVREDGRWFYVGGVTGPRG